MELNPAVTQNRSIEEQGATLSLLGQTAVVSGTFTEHSRDEYKERLEMLGAKISSSISSKTSFVLAGENMGPSKREKAEALGIQLIDEANFLASYGDFKEKESDDSPNAKEI